MRVVRLVKGERGQTLILFVGVITVVFVMAAVVIDAGLWLAERRSVQRAADLAAAAGAQDLLVSDSDAVAAAYEWADKNGYSGSEVNVQLLCYNSLSSSAICDNPSPGAGPVACTVGETCDSLRVTISKPSTMLFSSIFGLDAFDIEAGSAAGLTIQSVPVDTVLSLDATGSMGTTFNGICNAAQNNPTCPIVIARAAANDFVDVLLSGLNSGSRVGYGPYNYCYNPPFGNWECIKAANPAPIPAPTPNYPVNVVPLTANAAALRNSISTTTARGGTNICLGLDEAGELMSASAAGARKNVVLLTDGEGRVFYPDATYPPAVCRPPGNINISGCGITEANEGALDVKTLQRATALENQGIEIYVVALLLCGPEDGRTASPSYCAGVGNNDPDNIADQRLLKCVASSPDHYVKIDSASEIPDAFREIAGAIISRGLLE